MDEVTGTRTCTRCKKTKSLGEFYRDAKRKGGHREQCKECTRTREDAAGERARKAQHWAKLKADPVRHEEQKRKARERVAALSPEERSARAARRKASKYEEVCGGVNPDGVPLVVDHCHDTGRIRGLLCHRCNAGIGLLGDDVAGLMRAVRYLAAFEATTLTALA